MFDPTANQIHLSKAKAVAGVVPEDAAGRPPTENGVCGRMHVREEAPALTERELVCARDRHPVPGAQAIFPPELVGEFLFLIEELLLAFLIVVVGEQEIEPVRERALDTELQGMVPLLDAVGVPLHDARVVRVRAKKALQCNRSLIPKRAAHLVVGQQLVKRISYLLTQSG